MEEATFALAFVNLLVAIAAFLFIDSPRNQSIRIVLTGIFLLLAVVFASAGVIDRYREALTPRQTEIPQEVPEPTAPPTLPIASPTDVSTPTVGPPETENSSENSVTVFDVCTAITKYPGHVSSEYEVPASDTPLVITVGEGEIHALTGGKMRVADIDISLLGGRDRGSVIVFLPSATYTITELVAESNWHGVFKLKPMEATSLAEVLAEQQMITGTCSDGDGCSHVDVRIVGPEGVDSAYEKSGEVICP